MQKQRQGGLSMHQHGYRTPPHKPRRRIYAATAARHAPLQRASQTHTNTHTRAARPLLLTLVLGLLGLLQAGDLALQLLPVSSSSLGRARRRRAAGLRQQKANSNSSSARRHAVSNTGRGDRVFVCCVYRWLNFATRRPELVSPRKTYLSILTRS